MSDPHVLLLGTGLLPHGEIVPPLNDPLVGDPPPVASVNSHIPSSGSPVASSSTGLSPSLAWGALSDSSGMSSPLELL